MNIEWGAALAGGYPTGTATRVDLSFTSSPGEDHNYGRSGINYGEQFLRIEAPLQHVAEQLIYSPSALDGNGDTLSWRLIEGPRDARIDPKTGEVWWAPTGGEVARFVLGVTDSASSFAGLESLQAFTVKVADSEAETLVGQTEVHVGATALDEDWKTQELYPLTGISGPVVFDRNRNGIIELDDRSIPLAGGRYVLYDLASPGITKPYSLSVLGLPGLTARRVSQDAEGGRTYISRDKLGYFNWRGSDVKLDGEILPASAGGVVLPYLASEEAPAVAIPGVPFRYDLRHPLQQKFDLRYRLLNGPAGMAVDSKLGTVTWTPSTLQSSGTVKATIRLTDALARSVDIPLLIAVQSQPDAGSVDEQRVTLWRDSVVASRAGSNSVDIYWNTLWNQNVGSFVVERKTADGWTRIAEVTTGNSFRDNQATAASESYRLIAMTRPSGNGAQLPFAVAQVTVSSGTFESTIPGVPSTYGPPPEVVTDSPPDSVPPDPNPQPSKRRVTSTSVEIAWQKHPTNPVDRQIIEVSQTADFAAIATRRVTVGSGNDRYRIDGLNPNTEYHIRVVSEADLGSSMLSRLTGTLAFRTLNVSASGLNLEVIENNDANVKFTWTVGSENPAFNVYRVEADGNDPKKSHWRLLTSSPVADSKFTDANPQHRTLALYQFVPVGSELHAGDTSTVEVARGRKGAPDAPAELSFYTEVDQVTPGQFDASTVTIRWDEDPYEPKLDYIIERFDPITGTFSEIGERRWTRPTSPSTSQQNLLRFEDTSSLSDARYQYQVRARDVDGNLSGPSNVITVNRTQGVAPRTPVLTDARSLGVQTATSASGQIHKSAISLTWKGFDYLNRIDPDPNQNNFELAEWFEVYSAEKRNDDTFGPWELISTDLFAPEYILTGLKASTTYAFRIVAVGANGVRSNASNQMNVQTSDGQLPLLPSLPTFSPTATAELSSASISQVKLTLGAPTQGTKWRIYRSSTVATDWQVVRDELATGNWEDTTVWPGREYKYRAVVVQTDGDESTPTADLLVTAVSEDVVLGAYPPGAAPKPDLLQIPAEVRTVTDIFGVVGRRPDKPLTGWEVRAVPQSGSQSYDDSRTVILASMKVVQGGPSEISLGEIGMPAELAELDPGVLSAGTYKIELYVEYLGEQMSLATQMSQTVKVVSAASTGGMIYPVTDFSMPTAGLPLTFSRVYESSRALINTGLGLGWRHEWLDLDVRTTANAASGAATFQVDDVIYLTLPGGRQEAFSVVSVPSGGSSPAVFKALNGSRTQLTLNSANPEKLFRSGFEVTTEDGIKYLVTSTSTELNSVTTWQHRLSTVTDPRGNTLTITGSETGGRMTSSTGEVLVWQPDSYEGINGLGIFTGVDAQGHADLSKRVGIIVTSSSSGILSAAHRFRTAGTLVEQYTYIDGTAVSGVHRKYLEKVKIVNGLASKTLFTATYSTAGRLLSVTDAEGKVSSSSATRLGARHITVVNLPHNAGAGKIQTLEIVRDSKGNVVREIRQITPTGTSTADRRTSAYQVTQRVFDSNGWLTTEYEPFNATFDGRLNSVGRKIKVVYEYNLSGKVIGQHDGQGRRTLINDEPNLNRLKRTVTDSEGNQTILVYAYNESLKQETDLLRSRGSTGPTTHNFYDAQGRVTSVWQSSQSDMDAELAVGTQAILLSHTTYDSSGRVVASYDINRVTQYNTDVLAQVGSDRWFLGSFNHGFGPSGPLPAAFDSASGQPLVTSRFWKAADGTVKLITTTSTFDPAGRVLSSVRTVTPGNLNLSNGSFTAGGPVVEESSSAATYDAYGHTVTSTDDFLRVTTSTYLPTGELHHVTTPDGTVTEYNLQGRVIEVRHPGGAVTRTTYDADGRPEFTVERAVPASGLNGDITGPATRTVYDNLGQPIRTERLSAVKIAMLPQGPGDDRFRATTADITGSGAPLVLSRTFYDSQGRVIASEQLTGENGTYARSTTRYDEWRHLLSGSEGGVTGGQVVDFNSDNWITHPTTRSHIGLRTVTTDASGVSTTQLEYQFNKHLLAADPDILLKSVVRLTVTIPNWDGFESSSLGHARLIQLAFYDSSNCLVRQEQRIDVVGTFVQGVQRDQAGSITSVGGPSYGVLDVLKAGQDIQQKLISRTDFELEQTLTGRTEREIQRFQSLQAPSGVANPSDRTTTRTYDHAGRLLSVELPRVGTEAAPAIFAYTYDPLTGQQLTETDALGRTTRYAYDHAGRRTSLTKPPSLAEPNGTTESWIYDAHGRELSHTDFAGNRTDYVYYDADLDKSQVYFRQLRAETYTQAGATIPQRTREYLYDIQGRTQEVIEHGGALAAPITQSTVYVYDAEGNRTQRKEHRGPSGSTAAHEVVTWSFDPITGRQTGVTTFTPGPTASAADDHSTSTTYTHDILGRLSGSLVSTRVGTADPTLSSVTYRYDAYGNLKEQRTSDGITARRIYGYDHSGISVNLQPFGEADEKKFHHISAWERDKLVRLDYIRISATDYALLVEGSDEDATSPISAIANTPGELLWRQDIDYTPTGQKRTVVETSATATGFSSRRVDWAYDELDRLISEQVDSPGTANDYQTRYTLDMVGNRLSEVKIDGGGSSPTTITTTHSYRASGVGNPSATGYLDILTGTSSWKSAAGASQQLVEEVAFGYDLNGSMVTRTTSQPDSNGAPKQETETFTWDAAGRLTGFIADDLDPQTPADTTPDLTYTYDTQDRRSSRTTYSPEGTPEQTTWTRDESSSTGYDQILAERSDAGTPTSDEDDDFTTYLQGLSITGEITTNGQPATGNSATTYLADYLGSVRAISTNGQLAFAEYDAFGEVTSGQQFEFGYTGERYEPSLGLIDLRARFLQPSIGSFVSWDDWQHDTGDVLQSHKYLYTGHNPTNRTDPSGMFFGLVGSLGAIGGAMGLQSAFLGRAGAAWQLGKTLELMMFLNGTPTASSLQANQWQDPISSGLISSLLAIDEFMNPPGGPGFWEGAIPVWGAGKTAGAHLANGNYMAAAVFAGIGALDVFSIGAIGTVLRGAGRVGTGTITRLTARQIGDAGENAAVEMLARSGFTDILPIKNASNNGLDIVARPADGHFVVFEVKASASGAALASRSLPRSQAVMDKMLGRILEEAASAEGRYASIDAAQQAQAQALLTAWRNAPKGMGGAVSGAVIGVDVSTGTMHVARWARGFDQ